MAMKYKHALLVIFSMLIHLPAPAYNFHLQTIELETARSFFQKQDIQYFSDIFGKTLHSPYAELKQNSNWISCSLPLLTEAWMFRRPRRNQPSPPFGTTPFEQSISSHVHQQATPDDEEEEPEISQQVMTSMMISLQLNPHTLQSVSNSPSSFPSSDIPQSIALHINEGGAASSSINIANYPALSQLVTEITGANPYWQPHIPETTSVTLMNFLNEFIAEQLQNENVNKKKLKAWFRWVISGPGILILEAAVRNSYLKQFETALIREFYRQYSGIIRIITLLKRLGIQPAQHGQIIVSFLTSSMEGSMGIAVADQPLTVLLSALLASSPLLQHFTSNGLLTFDRNHMDHNASQRRERFRYLLAALDEFNSDISANSRVRATLSDGMFHVIKHEQEFLQQFSSAECVLPSRANIDRLMVSLDGFISQNPPLHGPLAASAMVSMIHMPCLITVLDEIFADSTSLHEQTVLQWLTESHSYLLNDNTCNAWQQVLLQAYLYAVGTPEDTPVANLSICPESLLRIIRHWIAQVHGNQELVPSIVSSLLVLNPELITQAQQVLPYIPPPCEEGEPQSETEENQMIREEEPVLEALANMLKKPTTQ